MYSPPASILRKYADVMVNFAVNQGKGIKKGEVVRLRSGTPGLPLMQEIYRALLAAGAHPIQSIEVDELDVITAFGEDDPIRTKVVSGACRIRL